MGLFDQEEQVTTDDPVDKNRLFETLKEESDSSRSYLKVFSIVTICVIVAGLIVYYLLMPGIGDQVRAPEGLEDAVRDHFRSVEKRTANEITFTNAMGTTGPTSRSRYGQIFRPIQNIVIRVTVQRPSGRAAPGRSRPSR